MSGYSTYTQQQEDIRAAQQEIGLAEIRIKQLQEQLTACERALAERDARVVELDRLNDCKLPSQIGEAGCAVCRACLDARLCRCRDKADRMRAELAQALTQRDTVMARNGQLQRLVWGAVHNAGRLLTSGRVPRWSAVMEALGVGSTTAHELCREHQLDPDELVGKGDLCGGCQRVARQESGLRFFCVGCLCPPDDQPFCTRETLCGCAKEEE